MWYNGVGGMCTYLLSQPPGETCSAPPAWWAQHFRLLGPRWWQPLTSRYPGSPNLNLSFLSLIVSAHPQGHTSSVPPLGVVGAVRPAISAQLGAADRGTALGRS